MIIPLLKHIRLKKELSSVLRWEGITIDPVGATLAVLIFDVMMAQSNDTVLGQVLLGIGLTLLLGVAFGILGAIILIVIIRRHLVPEYLQEAFTLIIVIGMYGLSDMIQGESGLLVVTIMGIILANQRIVTIKHIITFKEQLTVLLLSSVFVLLAARINISELTVFFNKEMLMFLLVLFFVSRPLTVFVSTLGSSLSIKERLFMSCMAPRGIVAAAVASLFSIKLVESGYEGAEVIQSIVFMVIIVTVTVYGLLGQPLAVFLGLKPAQKGIVIVGAHPWGRNIAKVLVSLNIDILLVDTKKENVIAAKEEQLKVIHGSILSKKVMEEIEFGIYGHLMAISKSDEINLLSNLEYAELFGRSETFRLRPKDRRRDLMIGSSSNFLFGNNATYPFISTRITAGAKVHSTIITKDFSYDFFLSSYPKAIPLFLVNTKNQLKIITKNTKIKTEEGEILVSII